MCKSEWCVLCLCVCVWGGGGEGGWEGLEWVLCCGVVWSGVVWCCGCCVVLCCCLVSFDLVWLVCAMLCFVSLTLFCFVFALFHGKQSYLHLFFLLAYQVFGLNVLLLELFPSHIRSHHHQLIYWDSMWSYRGLQHNQILLPVYLMSLSHGNSHWNWYYKWEVGSGCYKHSTILNANFVKCMFAIVIMWTEPTVTSLSRFTSPGITLTCVDNDLHMLTYDLALT